MQLFSEWLKRQLQPVNVDDIFSLYFWVQERLRHQVLPDILCKLIITVPPREWQWLCQDNGLLLQETKRALTQFVAWLLLQEEKPNHGIEVELRQGEDWSLKFEEQKVASRPQLDAPFGWFEIKVPGELGAQYEPWMHHEPPRLPTPDEEYANPSQILSVLNNLRLTKPSHRRWRDGECHIVCQCRVWFFINDLKGREGP